MMKAPKREPLEFRELVRQARNLIAHTAAMEDVLHQLRLQMAGADQKNPPAKVTLPKDEEDRLKRVIEEAELQIYGYARQSRELAKGRQLIRLEDTIVKAKAAGDHSAVVAAEREVAKIMGTYAPVQVNLGGLSAEVERTLQQVVASLGSENIAALLRGERPAIGVRAELLASGEAVDDAKPGV
jgi:hypothetical protein